MLSNLILMSLKIHSKIKKDGHIANENQQQKKSPI